MSEFQSRLERRESDRLEVKLPVKYASLSRAEADLKMNSGDFSDIFATDKLREEEKPSLLQAAARSAFTENLSITGLKLVGDLRVITGEYLKEGGDLLVEIELPGAPLPVRCLAVVIWIEPKTEGGVPVKEAGLFFQAVHKNDLEKVNKFLLMQKKSGRA